MRSLVGGLLGAAAFLWRSTTRSWAWVPLVVDPSSMVLGAAYRAAGKRSRAGLRGDRGS